MIMSAALVSGQAGQTVRQTNPATATRAQAASPASSATAKPAPAANDVAKHRAIVDQYCVTCHNTRAKTGNLMLDQLDMTKLGSHAEIAEKVVRKLRAGLMPPANMKRPDAAT
jgi:mono/diheme cytochrome c family protein